MCKIVKGAHRNELALEVPKLAIPTITTKISIKGKYRKKNIIKIHQCTTQQFALCLIIYMKKLPFGVQFKDVMSIVTFIGTGQADPSRLCSIGGAGVAGKHSLSLHIALQHHSRSNVK